MIDGEAIPPFKVRDDIHGLLYGVGARRITNGKTTRTTTLTIDTLNK
jgi:hypothetical protein